MINLEIFHNLFLYTMLDRFHSLKMNHAYIQNIWTKVKISGKTGLVQKNLLSTFT